MRHIVRGRRAAVLAAAAMLLSAGCRTVFDPKDLDVLGLDGEWELTMVNGVTMSSYTPGFPLPERDDFLRAGTLLFTTTLAWGGGGTGVDESIHEGTAVGVYELVNAQGTRVPPDQRAGDFEYDLVNDQVTLRALGRSATGTKPGQTITFTQQNLPVLGTVTLVFTKKPS